MRHRFLPITAKYSFSELAADGKTLLQMAEFRIPNPLARGQQNEARQITPHGLLFTSVKLPPQYR